MNEISSVLTIQRLPKLELHCHLLGTVYEQTVRDLLSEARQRAGSRMRNLPISDTQATAFYTLTEKPVGAIRMLPR